MSHTVYVAITQTELNNVFTFLCRWNVRFLALLETVVLAEGDTKGPLGDQVSLNPLVILVVMVVVQVQYTLCVKVRYTQKRGVSVSSIV